MPNYGTVGGYINEMDQQNKYANDGNPFTSAQGGMDPRQLLAYQMALQQQQQQLRQQEALQQAKLGQQYGPNQHLALASTIGGALGSFLGGGQGGQAQAPQTAQAPAQPQGDPLEAQLMAKYSQLVASNVPQYDALNAVSQLAAKAGNAPLAAQYASYAQTHFKPTERQFSPTNMSKVDKDGLATGNPVVAQSLADVQKYAAQGYVMDSRASAPRVNINATPTDWGISKQGANKYLETEATQAIAAKSSLNIVNDIKAEVTKNPTAIGFTGALQRNGASITSALDGIVTVAKSAGTDTTALEDAKYEDYANSLFKGAAVSQAVKSNLIHLAYLNAITQTPSGSRVTESHVKNSMDQLASHTNDPRQMMVALNLLAKNTVRWHQAVGSSAGWKGEDGSYHTFDEHPMWQKNQKDIVGLAGDAMNTDESGIPQSSQDSAPTQTQRVYDLASHTWKEVAK